MEGFVILGDRDVIGEVMIIKVRVTGYYSSRSRKKVIPLPPEATAVPRTYSEDTTVLRTEFIDGRCGVIGRSPKDLFPTANAAWQKLRDECDTEIRLAERGIQVARGRLTLAEAWRDQLMLGEQKDRKVRHEVG